VKSTGRILAVDYGEKRIGVALCDELQIVAKPYSVVKHRKLQTDLAAIRDIATAKEVVRVIVGLPTGGRGEIGRQAADTLLWTRKLSKLVSVPIFFWDESYSTVEAQTTRRNAKRSIRRSIDALAAAAILQDYLSALETSSEEPGTPLESLDEVRP
jgi:putative Holliday junction resolvase